MDINNEYVFNYAPFSVAFKVRTGAGFYNLFNLAGFDLTVGQLEFGLRISF